MPVVASRRALNIHTQGIVCIRTGLEERLDAPGNRSNQSRKAEQARRPTTGENQQAINTLSLLDHSGNTRGRRRTRNAAASYSSIETNENNSRPLVYSALIALIRTRQTLRSRALFRKTCFILTNKVVYRECARNRSARWQMRVSSAYPLS